MVCAFPVVPSPDGRFVALRVIKQEPSGGSEEALVILDLISDQIRDLTGVVKLGRDADIRRLAWAPSGVQLAVLNSTTEKDKKTGNWTWKWAISVVDTQTLNAVSFDFFTTQGTVLAFGWIP